MLLLFILINVYNLNTICPNKGCLNSLVKDEDEDTSLQFIKEKSEKYKGNFDFLVFRFLGMLMNFLATLKPGAALLRSCRFHRHPY